MKRILALALGVGSLLNGVYALLAGRQWYASVPGVSATGPFNPHFVADIGVAFAIAGAALAARAVRPAGWPAALAGAGFLGGHGLIHFAGLLSGHGGQPVLELGTVVLPAALAVYAALPDNRRTHHAHVSGPPHA